MSLRELCLGRHPLLPEGLTEMQAANSPDPLLSELLPELLPLFRAMFSQKKDRHHCTSPLRPTHDRALLPCWMDGKRLHHQTAALAVFRFSQLRQSLRLRVCPPLHRHSCWRAMGKDFSRCTSPSAIQRARKSYSRLSSMPVLLPLLLPAVWLPQWQVAAPDPRISFRLQPQLLLQLLL